MKIEYRLINYRTSKRIKVFTIGVDLNYRKSEYYGKYKIVDVKKITLTNKIYYNLFVIDPDDDFKDLVKKPK